MAARLESEIRDLRARFWSERDPEGRVFAPLADACRRAGDLDEASRLVSEGTERLPGYAPGHLVAARVARDRGEAQSATRAYRRVLDLDPENVEALRELAALAESEGWDPVAADLLHRLTLLEPEDGGIRERLRAVKRRCLADELGDAAEPPAPEPASEEEAPAPPEPAGAPAGEAEAGPEGGEPGSEVVTRTMGELYARQGHYDRAIRVFERLVESTPGDAGLRERLAELRARREGDTAAEAPAEAGGDAAGTSWETPEEPVRPGTEPEEPAGVGEAPPDEAEFRIERPEEPLWETEGGGEEPGPPPLEGGEEPGPPAFEGVEGADELGAGAGSEEPDTTETLAREWSEGPEETGDLTTPFAWDEDGGETTEGVSGPTISEHFRRLLEWTPPEPAPEGGEDPGPGGGGARSASPEEGDASASGSDEAGEGRRDTPRSRDPDFRRWLEGLDE